MNTLRASTTTALVMAAFISSISANEATTRPWQDVVAKSKGQTVYFNAWGGE
ncbi:hypothetical protein [Endozoicomonas sp. ONNA2]|uniref:hypothetical protein n=1 Tax=Endozoicomonas sp. ONNA2 TaxID=2828741 RepID=UPI002148825A|nr:hypothetical protein [Endozoicomonas sp. ONNA2]